MRRLSCISGALLSFLGTASLVAQAPTGTIRGRVVDAATLQPLASATVTFGSRGVLTRPDGRFVLGGLPVVTDTLRTRLLGYAPGAQTVSVVAGDTVVADFSLTAQALGLSEVVVVGYGEQVAGNITGAVSEVSSEEFNTGRVVNPANLIQGKVAGVQVVDNNEPGGGQSIRIRGTTSVNASNEPLYVIDGVPVGFGAGGGLSIGRDPLNSLNPEEIESITVLRDASAAAIYGANAANGVIIIQTKTGMGRPQFEYSGTVSGSSVDRLPSMLNAQQFATAVQQYAPQNVSQLQNENTDWFGRVGQSGFGQDHNLAVSGSDANTNWRLSVGYLNQDGIIQGTNVERLALGLNLNQQLFGDRMDVRATLKGSREDDQFTPGGVLSNAAQFGPTQPIHDSTTTTGFYEWPGNKLQSADNPMAILALATDEGTTYRSLGSVQASYRMPFLEALRAHVNLSYDVVRGQRNTLNPSTMHSETKDGTYGMDFRTSPSQSQSSMETYVSYAAPLNVVPGTIDVTGGYSYLWTHGEFPSIRGDSLRPDLTGGNRAVDAQLVTNLQDIQESKLISFFGRVNYNLNDRWLAGISLRRDGSSRFGPENQWATFPAVAAAWRLSQESFLTGVSWISDLKLRASWAKTGNQAFANYQQYATYRPGDPQTTAQFGGAFVPTIRPGAYDPNIKWESTGAVNIGLDFGLWSQRLTGALDWYTKNTEDLIFQVPVCAGCNLSNYAFTNIGSMKNTGAELNVSWRALEQGQGGLNWTADFAISHNTNEMVSIYSSAGTTQILTGNIAGGVGSYIQVLQPGHAANSFYVYRHIRGANGQPIWEDRTGSDANGQFTGVPDGTINEQDLYEDLNGDNRINQDDRAPFHSPDPKWILGHSSYVTYGHFDFGFTLRAYMGNWVYNNVASNLGTYSEVGRGAPYNLHSSVLETGFESQQLLSDYYVEDASFLRMDNISLGYSFRYGAQQLRVFGVVQNAFTITGYSGVDPTAGLLGIDNNIYPRSRTFTGGLNIRF